MNIYQGLLDLYPIEEEDFESVSDYELDSESLRELNRKYSLDQIAGNGTDYERAYAIMEWINSILIHEPDYHNQLTDNADVLLTRLLEKKPINCRAAANIMVECFLALGIKAQAVWLLSANPYDNDCHVVPVAYCRELKKWIIFDATVHTTILNENNEPLSIFEVRDYLAKEKRMEYSPKLRYVRTDCSYTAQRTMFTKYLCKNFFMMRTYLKNCFGYEGAKGQKYINLVAPSFDVDRYYKLQQRYWKETGET